jgi:hypothetical protein
MDDTKTTLRNLAASHRDSAARLAEAACFVADIHEMLGDSSKVDLLSLTAKIGAMKIAESRERELSVQLSSLEAELRESKMYLARLLPGDGLPNGRTIRELAIAFVQHHVDAGHSRARAWYRAHKIGRDALAQLGHVVNELVARIDSAATEAGPPPIAHDAPEAR